MGQDIKFSHLNTNDGLSHVSVLSLYMDEYNSLWIGTREGLNRYDGLNVESYKRHTNNSQNLSPNNILKITGNKKGQLYILSTEGVSEYDIALDKFSTVWQDSEIKSILYQEHLYIGRKQDIFVLDEATNKFVLEYSLPNGVTSISNLLVDNIAGLVYVGTNIGVYTIDNKGRIEHKIKTNSTILDIYKDEDNDIWISSWNDGAFLISEGAIKQFTHRSESKNCIASNFVRTCCQDNQSNVWIATFAGLNKYDKKTGDFTLITPNGKSDGLSHSSIWSIVKDHQGTLWLGTYFGGVNYFNPEYVIYSQYRQSKTEKEGLSSPIVGRMTEDKDGNLWICTEGEGLNVYNRKTKTFKWYLPHRGDNSIADNNVKAIHYDKKRDVMWLGTYLGGLDKLDIKTGHFTHYKYSTSNPQSIPSNMVRDIVAYEDKLFLATDNGVGVFDTQSEKCEMLFTDPIQKGLLDNIFALHLDHLNNLWMSVVGEGVYRYNLHDKTLKNYRHEQGVFNGLSNNNINSITRDSKNKLYFCTSGRGFDVFDSETESFENYDSKKNHLISDFVYNILEANPEDYLIITNQGLSRFNPRTGKFRNYNRSNGFPLSIINDNALYLTADGEVFLGGVDGMVSFHLDGLNFAPKNYDIHFSKLYVNNREIMVGDETGILSHSFFLTPSIKLDAKYNTFEVEVTSTNYISSNKEGLLYQLKGFSDEWIPLRDAKITYTNLDPGNYTLSIRRDNDIQSDLKIATLEIEILPPFYKSPLAYITYIVFLSILLFYLVKSYDRRIKLQASLAYEQKHLQDVEMLNQSKLRFFTNISHEFRTPLTVIMGQLNSLINKPGFTSDVYDMILSAYRNSSQLKELISELLDFRKQEQGHMTISPSKQNIVEFVKENFILFEEYAKTKDISFTFESTIEELDVWYDARQLQKVINNLLSNAFKYTPSGGVIGLSIHHNESECCILVSDNGEGIKKEDLDRIFERFYQVEGQDYPGSGIGLALSKGITELHKGKLEVESVFGEGSLFKITLPLGCNHFTPDQINSGTVKDTIDGQTTKRIKEFTLKQSDSSVIHKAPSDTRILIVEDNEDLRNMLVSIFTPFYITISASDGQIGLEKVYEEKPDIILSDIVMPNMTGIELCKAVKSDINICHIPFVLLTAKTSIDHTLEGLGIGADDYITKPFDVEVLLSRCNNLIAGRRLLLQVFSKQPEMEILQLASNSLDKQLIEQAIDIVERNLDNLDFSIYDFSRQMAMSRTNLFTKIKALTGQTPNAFITTIRLKKAAYLLKNRLDLNISEISVITGFSTSHYFSKCFKDAYKQTPSEYRGIE